MPINMLTNKRVAQVLGVILVLVGVIPMFISNPIFGTVTFDPRGFFALNLFLNALQILTGALLLLAASVAWRRYIMLAVAIVYALLGIFGFMISDALVWGPSGLGIVNHIIHWVVAVVLIASWWLGGDHGRHTNQQDEHN